MNEIIPPTLTALKDVDGVQGSFVLGKDGRLVALAMPALFDERMFVELGPRIERMSESFSALGDELDSCVLRFSEHVLCIKRFSKGGMLCVLAGRKVNLPALRMAMNLAERRITNAMHGPPQVNGHHATAVAASVAAPGPAAPAPAGTEAAQAVRRAPRYFRGHLVED